MLRNDKVLRTGEETLLTFMRMTMSVVPEVSTNLPPIHELPLMK
jgi:hypothetical protein